MMEWRHSQSLMRKPLVVANSRRAIVEIDSSVITVIISLVKIAIRRVGNSLGVILPKFALDSWGLGEGDFL